MGWTAIVSVVDGIQLEFKGVAGWYTTDDVFFGLHDDSNNDIAVFHKAHVKAIAFKEEKPEPPAPMPSGHNCAEKTGFSAGDRAVVTLPGDQWRNMTVDILGPLTFPPNTYATKIRGEVLVSVYHRDNLRLVPEERRNESR